MNSQVHIVGVGGIGAVLAWSLARAGWAVTLVESRPDKVAAGRTDGLIIAGQSPLKLPFVHFSDWQPPSDTIILLCTKTYNNAEVLARLDSCRHLVPVQNGYDTLLNSRDYSGEGIASFVSECECDRPLTRITRPGSLHIGARRTTTAEERAGRARPCPPAYQQSPLSLSPIESRSPHRQTARTRQRPLTPSNFNFLPCGM